MELSKRKHQPASLPTGALSRHYGQLSASTMTVRFVTTKSVTSTTSRSRTRAAPSSTPGRSGSLRARAATRSKAICRTRTTIWFHVSARLGDDVCPWSDFAMFRTFDRPVAAAAPARRRRRRCRTAVPDPGCLRAPATATVSPVSRPSPPCRPNGPGCAGGSGVGCHRFTRQVVYALSQSDPELADDSGGSGRSRLQLLGLRARATARCSARTRRCTPAATCTT